MKILITGGLGFIGSALVRRCLADGHQVLNIDKQTYAANVNSVPSNAFLFKEDVCDYDAMSQSMLAFKPDWVFHLAAESHVDRSIEASHAFYRTNVMGTHSMIEAFRQYYETNRSDDLRFIHVSTDEVFGQTTPDSAGFNEASPYDPRSPYAASKAASDHIIKSYRHTYGLPASITNCCNNYGPWQNVEKFIPKIISNALQNKAIPVYGKGDQYREWIYVDDHVDALLFLAPKNIPQTVIGGNYFCKNIDMVKMISELMDCDMRVEFVKDRLGHDQCYKIDGLKLKEYGWTHQTSISSGLKNTMKFYLDNAYADQSR